MFLFNRNEHSKVVYRKYKYIKQTHWTDEISDTDNSPMLLNNCNSYRETCIWKV